MNGKRSISTTVEPSLTFIIFIVSEKIAALKAMPHTDTRPASLTLIITYTHILSSVSNCSRNINKKQTKKQTNKQHCETKLNLIDPPPPPQTDLFEYFSNLVENNKDTWSIRQALHTLNRGNPLKQTDIPHHFTADAFDDYFLPMTKTLDTSPDSSDSEKHYSCSKHLEDFYQQKNEQIQTPCGLLSAKERTNPNFL